MRLIIIMCTLWITTSVLSAQSWTGAGDGISWSDEDNWNPSVLPDLTSIVNISTDSVVVYEGKVALFDSITISGSNAVVYIERGAEVSGKSIVLRKGSRFYNKGEIGVSIGRAKGIITDTDCKFINFKKISISGVKGDHINNIGVFTNEETGTILSSGTIKTENSIINNGSLINKGSIMSIDMRTAIISNSNFINNGLVQGSQLVFGINGTGSFWNTAEIQLSYIESRGITANGPSNWLNDGTINIEHLNTGESLLVLTSDFYNNGTINISNVASSGLEIGVDAVFNNQESGILNINKTSLLGIESRGGFNNLGQVSILDVNTGIQTFNNTDINNIGILNIDSCDRAITMFAGTIGNLGEIIIENASTGVLMISSSSTLFRNTSEGTITYLQTTLQIQTFNQSTFISEPGAAIYFDSTSTAILLNSGTVYEISGILDLIPD